MYNPTTNIINKDCDYTYTYDKNGNKTNKKEAIIYFDEKSKKTGIKKIISYDYVNKKVTIEIYKNNKLTSTETKDI